MPTSAARSEAAGKDDAEARRALAWTHTARFLTTASALAELPVTELPEIAFVGRSNAGKSTAINVLTQQKRLAFASKTPGRTQHINLFELGPKLAADALFADLPGYGYAAVERNAKLRWQEVMAEYLAVRRSLSAIVVLVDSRLGFTDIDRKLLDFVAPRLANGSVKLLALLTKVDKLNRRDTGDRAAGRERRPRRGGLRGERRVARRRSRRSAAPASTTPRACSTPGRTGAPHDRDLHHRRSATASISAAAPPAGVGDAGARLPARLSRGGVRLGRAARAFLRPLSLRRAEPARLRAVVGAAGRRGVSRQAPRRRHLVADRFARRRARRAGRARLGRRARLGPGGATARGDPAPRHHQLAASRDFPARAAPQPGAAGGERLHELPVPPRRGSAAERERLRAPVAVLHQHGRRRSGARKAAAG